MRQALIVLLLAALAGCGSVRHNAKLNEGYRPPEEAKITVGTVRNSSGNHQDIRPDQRLKEALVEALREEGILWLTDGIPLILDAEIVEYEPGNAFKRWLLPGYGATVLTVRATLKEKDKVVATAESRRTVSFGGGYSVGAWKSIFRDVAEDLAKDLKAKLRG